MAKGQFINDSEFALWRTLVAFALVDHRLTLEEQSLLSGYLAPVRFSGDQMARLREDFKTPQDVEALYSKITDPIHRARFCEMARTLVWSKGDMELQEKIILRRVSCLGSKEGRDTLQNSRHSLWLSNFHAQYERAGMLGQGGSPNLFQASI